MGEKEETGKEGKDSSILFPPIKKKKEGFFSRLFHHKKEEEKSKQKSFIENIPEHHHFVLTGGKKIKNIPQMIIELKNISDDVFKKHINEEKNDVANWIGDVFKDPDLAEKIRKAKRKKNIIKLLEKGMKKTEKEFNEMKEKLQKEELEKSPTPPLGLKLSKLIKPPKAPKKSEIRIIKPSKKVWETISPPLPPREVFKKKRMPSKTKEEHEEIDKLITLKEEKERIEKKRSMILTKERSLDEKNRKIYEHEIANKRTLKNIEKIKRVADHDVRERLAHVMSKQKELQDLKLKVDQERKKIEEKNELLDKLRKKYLDTISKEKYLEVQENKLKNREKDLKTTQKGLQKIKSDLDEKLKTLKSRLPNISKWDSKFNIFNNLKHQLEIREREMKPILSRFEDDIQLLTKKEKTIIGKINLLEKDEKILVKKENDIIIKANKLIKKEKDILEKNNILKNEKSEMREKEKSSSKLEKELKRNMEKVLKARELKENMKSLGAELKAVEKQLKNKSDILLSIPKRKEELKQVEDILFRKRQLLEEKEEEIKIQKNELEQEGKEHEEEMEQRIDKYIKKSMSPSGVDLISNEKGKEYIHNEIYVLIDNCRILIDSKDLDAAKVLYNKIRRQFLGLDLKETEKEILKSTIKEIYQQINIATLA